MAKSWKEIVALPAYQQLPPENQEAVRQAYFDEVVAPTLSFSDLADARSAFEEATAPPPPPKQNASFAGDVVDLTQRGFLNSVGGVLDFVGADTGAQYFYDQGEKQRATMTPETQTALEQPLFDDQGAYYLGEGASNPRAWLAQGIETLGGSALPIPGGFLAKAALRPLLGLGAAAQAVKGGLMAEGLAARAATRQARELAPDWRDTAAMVGGYGGMEGAVSAGLTEQQVREQVLATPQADLEATPEYWQAMQKTGGDPAAARTLLAENLGKEAGLKVFGLTALLGAGAGRYYDRLVGGAGSGSRLVNAGKGAVTEALEEAPQSLAETLATNSTMQTVDPGLELGQGAVANMLTGATMGAAVGGVMGGVLPKGQVEERGPLSRAANQGLDAADAGLPPAPPAPEVEVDPLAEGKVAEQAAKVRAAEGKAEGVALKNQATAAKLAAETGGAPGPGDALGGSISGGGEPGGGVDGGGGVAGPTTDAAALRLYDQLMAEAEARATERAGQGPAPGLSQGELLRKVGDPNVLPSAQEQADQARFQEQLRQATAGTAAKGGADGSLPVTDNPADQIRQNHIALMRKGLAGGKLTKKQAAAPDWAYVREAVPLGAPMPTDAELLQLLNDFHNGVPVPGVPGVEADVSPAPGVTTDEGQQDVGSLQNQGQSQAADAQTAEVTAEKPSAWAVLGLPEPTAGLGTRGAGDPVTAQRLRNAMEGGTQEATLRWQGLPAPDAGLTTQGQGEGAPALKGRRLANLKALGMPGADAGLTTLDQGEGAPSLASLARKPEVSQGAGELADVAESQPAAYETRYQDRVTRLQNATTPEEVDAILTGEEYQDPERHIAGTGKVEKAAKAAKQRIATEATRAEAEARGEWVLLPGGSRHGSKQELQPLLDALPKDDGYEYQLGRPFSPNGSDPSNPVYRIERRKVQTAATPENEDLAQEPGASASTVTQPAGNAPAAPKEYRYALFNRPAGLGATPKNYLRVDPRPEAGQDHHATARHGVIVYDRPLTPEEMQGFELQPLVDGAEREALAETVASKLARYRDRVLAMADEGDFGQVRSSIANRFERFHPENPSIGDFDAFVQQVVGKLRAAAGAVKGAETPELAPVSPAPNEAITVKDPTWGANNTLVTREMMDDLRKRAKAKLAQLNAGIDPEMLTIMTQMAAFHLEAGARRFADFARTLAADLETDLEQLRPYLRSAYNGARDLMEDSQRDVTGIDTPEVVRTELDKLFSAKLETTATTEEQTDDQAGSGTADQSGERQGGGGPVRGRRRTPEPDDRPVAGDPATDGGRPGAAGDTGGVRASDAGAPRGDGGPLSGSGDGLAGQPGAGQPGLADLRTGNRGRPAGRRGTPTGDGGAGASAAEGEAGGGTDSAEPSHADSLAAAATNFHADDPLRIYGGTPKERFRKNQRAIELYRQLEETGRAATPEEQETLAGYTGFGSFGQELFKGTWERADLKDGWTAENEWLRNFLGESEWKSAQASIINAHYTDPPSVQAIWVAVRQLGFTGGRVLEPSAGIGNFFALMPLEMQRASKLTGIELDELTAGMLKRLYPEANIQQKPYQDSQTPDNFYDLVIGNWPFSSAGPADRRYNALSPSLHDYFFLKALDQVRPGGLVVGITSRYTLDGKATGVRQALARKADLVAAFRLPSGAFEEYAGTKVVTDVLILQKRQAEETNPSQVGWTQTQPMAFAGGEQAAINRYYHEHPDQVLGTLDWGSGTTYGRAGVIVQRPEDLAARLAQVVERLPAGLYQPASNVKAQRYLTNNTQERHRAVVVGPDGGLYQIQGERMVALEDEIPYKVKDAKKTAAREAQVRALVGMRQAYGALIDAERDGAPGVEDLRKTLKGQYDAFVAAHGRVRPSAGMNILKRIEDPFYPSLMALEREKDGVITPMPILERSVMRRPARLDNPSIRDAYVLARNQGLVLDMAEIARLAKVTPAAAAQELIGAGAIFRTPEGGYEPADVYLGGNVRRKLREAQAAAEQGEEMAHNIAELEKVIPPDVPYFNIEARLGAQWVAPRFYRDFVAEELLGVPEQADNLEVEWRINRWVVKPEEGLRNTAAAVRWRTIEARNAEGEVVDREIIPFRQLVEAAFNNGTMRLTARDSDGNVYVREALTAAANEKAGAIREAFEEWVWKAPERKVALERDYNEVMNAIANPKFDGSFLAFEGMALQRGDNEFSLRSHQSNAIWRGLVQGAGLYAHEVGTGKAGSLDSLLLTPAGWMRMGDVKVGDYVITQSGEPTRVEGVYPQGDKDIYRVTFSDGSSTECCDEHLWLTQTYRERIAAINGARLGKDWPGAQAKVRPLEEIRKTLIAPHLGAKNHSIPIVEPVQFEAQPVPMDPYLLGALLGDGHIGQKVVSFSKPDRGMVEAFVLPDGVRLVERISEGKCATWGFCGIENRNNPMLDIASQLGLAGKLAPEKFVPECYQFNSVDVRLAVLRGLMDTDGSVDQKGTGVSFCTASERLADDVTFLVRSLGGITKRTMKIPRYTYKGEQREGLPAIILSVCMPPNINPFLLPRKADRVVPKTKYLPARYIVAVEPVGRKPAQCIRVAHESRLYVADDFIVTHNTYTMAGIAVESRRFGLAKKPLILAHNANSASVAAEIQEMYPGAKVLYVNNLQPKRVKETLVQIRNDDWDAVVMPHSLLDRLTLTGETLHQLAAEEIAALEAAFWEAMNEAEAEGGNPAGFGRSVANLNINDEDAIKKLRNPTAKELATARLKILERIRRQAQESSRADAVTFEDLGVDMLMVDEAHLFKKPPMATRMKMRGLQKQISNRSVALKFLTDYIKNQNSGRGVHLFTGTPITNTLAEIFHMQRYVMQGEMKRDGIGDWDGWFNTFATGVSDVEFTAAGDYQPVTKLAGFINVAELRRMMSPYMDVVFADDMPEFTPRLTANGKTLAAADLTEAERDYLLNGREDNPVGRPYRKVVMDVAEMSPEQQAILAHLQGLAEEWRAASGRDRRDWMLEGDPHSPIMIEGAAARAGMDARMEDLTLPDYPANKINRAVRNIMRHYVEEPLAGQVVFMDKGYSDTRTVRGERVPGLNLAKELREKLIAAGIPTGEIAIVAGGVTPEQKKAVADAVNAGKIRVVIGQTETLGTGVNMQQRLRAMHHLDAPWMPGELEQRNGRGWRQGNSWNTVMEYRYITERIDGKRWQVLAVKDRFIKAFLKADADTRVIEGDAVSDEEGGYAETLSEAVGDQRLLQRQKLRADLDKLNRRERAHAQGIVEAREKLARNQRAIPRKQALVASYQGDAEVFTEAEQAAGRQQQAQYRARLDAYLQSLDLDLTPAERAAVQSLGWGTKQPDRDLAKRVRAAVLAAEADGRPRPSEPTTQPFAGQLLNDRFTTRDEMTEALKSLGQRMPQGESGYVDVGDIFGFRLQARRLDRYTVELYLVSRTDDQTRYRLWSPNATAIVNETLRGLRKNAEAIQGEIKAAQRDQGKLAELAKQPFARAEELARKRARLAEIEQDMALNPVPAPAWLRHGAPLDTQAWWRSKPVVVEGHQWAEDGYFVHVLDGDRARRVPYLEIQDANGTPVYEPHDFTAPVMRAAASAQESSGPVIELVGDEGGEGPVFSKSAGQAGAGASPAAVQAAVNRITAKWARAPGVVVFTGMEDPQVDAAVRREYAKQTRERLAKDPNAAADQVDAFYFRGRVYLNTETVRDYADLERALRHEALGHAGLRGLFGSRLNGILDQVIAGQRAAVEAKATARGLDMAKLEEARTAAEEVLAELAETRPQLGVVRRAVALIRRLLREMGVTLALSDADLIAGYILPARDFIERGRAGKEGGTGGLVPAFSLTEAATAREFRETEERYAAELRAHDEKDQPLRAPNGQPSKLNRRQWVQVRTPTFKAWFGDWERAEQRRFLEGQPVSELRGDEFSPDGVPLTVKVPQWYREQGVATVRVDGIGDVFLDERAVKDSLSHGIGRDKASAFAAVPDVLRLGRLVASESSPSDPKMTGLFIAAPLRMGGKDYVAVVLVRSDQHARRMYVHEVVLREKLQVAAFKTGALSAKSGAPTGAAPGAIRSVVEDVFSVNPDGISKVIDANGEPQVMYHVTDADFTVFDGDKAKRAAFGAGHYFTDDLDSLKMQGTVKGKNVMSVYLRIAKPATMDKVRNAMKAIKSGSYTFEQRVEQGKAVTAYLKRQGFDGVAIPDGEFNAFGADQIKSATNNNGAFDQTNPDIRFRLSSASGGSPLGDQGGAAFLNKTKTALGHRWTQALGSREGSPLMALTLRQLSEVGAKWLPGIETYNRLRARMETRRNVMMEESGRLGDALDSWSRRHADEARQVWDLANDSTLAQVDPSDYQVLRIPLQLGPGREFLRNWAATAENVAELKRRAKVWRASSSTREREAGAYYAAAAVKLAKAVRMEAKRRAALPALQQRWAALSDGKTHLDANGAPFATEVAARAAQAKLPAKAGAVYLIETVPGGWAIQEMGGQQAYTRMRDLYKKRSGEMMEALIERLNSLESLDEASKAALAARIRAEFENPLDEKGNPRIGPYFPLQRFGNFFLFARRYPEGEPRTFQRQDGEPFPSEKAAWSASAKRADLRDLDLKVRPLEDGTGFVLEERGEEGFWLFESPAERSQAAAELKGEGWTVIRQGLTQEASRALEGVSEGFMADAVTKLKAQGSLEEADTLYQMYLQTLQQMSIRKRFIHRKGTKGYTDDVLRSYGWNMVRQAHQISKLEGMPPLEKLLRDIEEGIKTGAQDQPDQDTTRQTALLVELKKRHEAIATPDGSAITNMLSALGFVFYLGVSPAAALVNLSQVPIVALPALAARYGSWGAAAKGLTTAFVDVARGFSPAVMKGFVTGRPLPSDAANLNDEERAAFVAWSESGVRDRTQAHNLAGIAEADSLLNGPTMNRVMGAVSSLFHAAEVLNRDATLLAAFRLARAKGIDPQTAIQQAEEATWESHFDYCVPTDTEMLTTRGWKLFDEIAQDDVAMAIDDEGRAVESEILEVNVFRGPNRVVEFSHGQRRLAFAATLAHEHIVCTHDSKTKKYGRPRKVRTDQLLPSTFLLRAPRAEIERPGRIGTDFAALLGWIAAEGWYAKFRGCKHKSDVRLEQSQEHNPTHVATIRALLDRLGGEYQEYPSKGGKHRLWVIRGQLRKDILAVMPNNLLNTEMLRLFSAGEMRALLTAFAAGDGHRLKNTVVISQSGRTVDNLDILQAMATTCGMVATMGATDRLGRKTLIFNDGGWRSGHHSQIKQMERRELEVEDVWCPTTAHGTWIARRNGAVVVTGNSNANRARLMQGNVAKVVLMFKNYAQHVLYFMGRNLFLWAKGESTEVRQEARTKFAGMMGMTALFAGVAGLPIGGVFVMANALQALFGDDDEPWDAEIEFRNWLAATFPDPVAGMIDRGAVTRLSGLDFASRVSIRDLLWRSPDRDLDGKGLYQHVVEQLLGPIGGLAARPFTMADEVADGNWARAAEAAVPKFARDLLQAGRFGVEGVTTRQGYPVMTAEELSSYELFWKAMGMQPDALAVRWDANSATKLYETRIMNRRKALITAAALAMIHKDAATLKVAREEIAVFNRANPEVKIGLDTLTRSVRGRNTMRERAQFGVLVNPKLAGLRETAGGFGYPTGADEEEDPEE